MRSSGLGLLNEREFADFCLDLVGAMSISMAACSAEFDVLFATEPAAWLIDQFRGARDRPGVLPAALRDALETYVDRLAARPGNRQVAPERVETPDGKLVVLVAGLQTRRRGRVRYALRLHEEILRRKDMLVAARQRYGLTVRELRLASLLLARKPTAEIARALRLRQGTVRVYLHALFEKLGVHSRGELIAHLEHLRRSPV
jgi:DNA-binding CsgD family transcriptional regulator